MHRYIEVPLQLLDIEGEGFHIMVKGTIHGKEANFLIDTGASRSVFDPKTLATFIDDLTFEKKEGITAGVGGSDLESSTFTIDMFTIGDMEIHDYEGVALDMDNIHELYGKLALPHIDEIHRRRAVGYRDGCFAVAGKAPEKQVQQRYDCRRHYRKVQDGGFLTYAFSFWLLRVLPGHRKPSREVRTGFVRALYIPVRSSHCFHSFRCSAMPVSGSPRRFR